MNSLNRTSHSLNWRAALAGYAAQGAAARRGTNSHRGFNLSAWTLLVIGGLSLVIVAGFAFMDGTSNDAAPNEAGLMPSATLPAPPTDSILGSALQLTETLRTEAILPAPSPVLPDPTETASISPAPPAPAALTTAHLELEEARDTAGHTEGIGDLSQRPTPVTEASRPVLSAAEASAYLVRAETAFEKGDLVVARAFFGRLAQAGDPRGALGMARTYDAAELRKVPVYRLLPDTGEAERWRARARDMSATRNFARHQ
jgi:hypothetical protein